MTSDEVNNVTGKKSIIFKRQNSWKKLNASGVESCWAKATLELFRFELSQFFLFFFQTKKNTDFGRDLTNAWTYPALWTYPTSTYQACSSIAYVVCGIEYVVLIYSLRIETNVQRFLPTAANMQHTLFNGAGEQIRYAVDLLSKTFIYWARPLGRTLGPWYTVTSNWVRLGVPGFLSQNLEIFVKEGCCFDSTPVIYP